MSDRRVLLSLHDVTPAHLARLSRAEAIFRELGVSRVAYLLVPRYHGAWPADRDPDFLRWCRGPRPFAVEWCLHGCLHEERPLNPPLELRPAGRSVRRTSDVGAGLRLIREATGAWFSRRFLTDGEGEFLDLDEVESRALINQGLEIFTTCLGAPPSGFVAPAWLFRRNLLAVLRDAGFTWTEDQWRIYDVRRSRTLDVPAITWSSRTRARRYLSARLSRGLLQRWRAHRLIRIALHPFDFDHPRVVAAITRTIAAALQDREMEAYGRLMAMAEPRASDPATT